MELDVVEITCNVDDTSIPASL